MSLKRIIFGLSIMISTIVVLIGVTEDKAYAEEFSSPTVNVTAIAPENYRIHDTYLTFSDSSAPSTMYYQRQIYDRIYKGYSYGFWNLLHSRYLFNFFWLFCPINDVLSKTNLWQDLQRLFNM